MKNRLGNLHDHLMARIEALGDEGVTGEALKEEIARSKANQVRSAWDGRFGPGDDRSVGNWRKMVAHPNSVATRFSKGRPPGNERPMFSERVCVDRQTGTPAVLIKVLLPDPHRPHLPYSWIRKAVWVWRKAGREIPDGHAVVHLDGDPMNWRLDNLDRVHAFLQHGKALGELVVRGRPARPVARQIGLAEANDESHGDADPGQYDRSLPPPRGGISLRSLRVAPGGFGITFSHPALTFSHPALKPLQRSFVSRLMRVHAFLQRDEALREIMVRGRLAHGLNISPIAVPGKCGGGPTNLALAAIRTTAEGAPA
ncbi:MAG: hypothetical protein F4145_17370 [Boseongicola sp. SB0675_bin_26]|nr:hypothetical protein [Boseongicola sp. SB0675_bin_26]